MSKPLLDIIITHYNEPWKDGKPMFDMIENQRRVDFNDFTVTLVHSGDGIFPWEDELRKYSYPVKLINMNAYNVASARNEGLRSTQSDWVMFCDFDDMFGDVCAMRMILDQFPVKDYDVIWGKVARETRWQGKHVYINCEKEANFASLFCKMYRRQFLKDKQIQFNSDYPLYSDYMFNSVVLAETNPFRIATLTTEFYPYYTKYRINSMTHDETHMEALINGRFSRDLALAEEFKRRGLKFQMNKALVSIICSEYFRMYDPDAEENTPHVSDRFIQFYRQHKDALTSISSTETEVIRDFVETETMNMIQTFYNDHKKEYYYVNDSMPFEDWLKIADEMAEEDEPETDEIDNEPVPVEIAPEEPTYQHEPRVAVYCGTYNTYMNMATSAKSLLWNTRMDKIYFLIEDDEFPYELPDNGIIECINVKNQKYFPPDGPNFNNSWSYMCMMRAAFSKLIPYDKILSLDIDVVIQEDIGCLWDLDLTDYYLAGVPEPQRQKSTNDPLYINFGVVMMNLAKIREDGIDDQVIKELNTSKFGCPEQDAFNKCCAWNILQLPNDYNATIHSHITGEAEKERIIHYAGIRFWRHFGHVKEYNNRKWDNVIERQRELQ